MVKIAGISLLTFSLLYLLALTIYYFYKKWDFVKEYQKIKNKGYAIQHEEAKAKESIYHSRLVGKVKARRSTSEEARAILEEVKNKKEDFSLEEEMIVEEQDEEELPEYMVEKIGTKPEDEWEEIEDSITEDVPVHEEDINNKETGLLESEGSNETGLLESDEDRNATGLLEGEEDRNATGLLESEEDRNATGLLEEDSDSTGLLDSRREATGLLSKEKEIDMNKVFKGN